jgi:hypothetical protein
MTDEMLHAVLETAGAKLDKEGWSSLPEGRTMTLYAAHAGVSLTIGKVEAVKVASATKANRIAWAKSSKGEIFVIELDDLFAAALDRGNDPQAGRKAGFLG